MDKVDRDARNAIPPGYAEIRFGPIRPDDLLFCWTDGNFYPADSPTRKHPAGEYFGAPGFLVIRKAAFDGRGYGSQRRYTIDRSTPPAALPSTTTPAKTLPERRPKKDDQRSLF